MSDKYGNYTILQVFDQTRYTEHCNVGVLLFDQDGRNAGCKADTNVRAIRMGVLSEDWADSLTILDFERRMKTMQDLEQLKATLGSTAHAMSIIQFRNPLPTLLYDGCLESIFASFVLGKKHERRSTGG